MKRATKETKAKIDALAGHLPGIFGNTFEAMGIAEEEIASADLTKEQNSRAFKVLCPPPVLRSKALELYRAHARELVFRVKAGRDLRPATNAELLAIFSDTSLIAPMGRNGSQAFEALWARVFPGRKIEGVAAFVGESWPGAISEVIETARKKFTVDRGGEA